MTSRERVLAALNHQEPDRVPIDLSGHRSSGIAAMAYARLRDYLGLPKKPIRVYDPVQQLAIVDEDVLQRFQVDTIELGRAFALEDKWWSGMDAARWHALPDARLGQARARRTANGSSARRPRGRVIARMPEASVLRANLLAVPRRGRPGPGRRRQFRKACGPPSPRRPGRSSPGRTARSCCAEGARRLRQQTDRAIIGLFGGNLLEIGQFLYRNDNFFMLLAGEPGARPRVPGQADGDAPAQPGRFLGAVGDSH